MAEMEIKRNERVMAMDGTEVGHVTHVIVDGPTHQVTDIVVSHDGQEMLVPISNVERGSGNELMLRATASQFAGAGMFNREGYHEVDEEELESTPMRSGTGNATIEHADRDSVVIDSTAAAATQMPRTTERAVPVPPRTTERVTETTARQAPAQQVRGNEEIVVPVVEERLTAGVREQEAGRFRLRKDVITEQQSVDVPVQREEVFISKQTVNRPATQADLSAMDQDINVPIREQEVFTSKQAVVTGEVDVRKEVTTETERVTDTVRREEVHVEGGSRVHTEGTANTRNNAMSEMDRARYARFTDTERTQYDAMSPDQQRTWGAEYDRRNPIQKIEDKITGRDNPRR